MSDPLADLQTIRNNPLDDLKDIRGQVTRTSTLTPAQSARQHLASRNLTPEMVKAGKGITTPEQFSSPPGMSGGQIFGSLGEGLLNAIPSLSPIDPTNMSGPISGVQTIAGDLARGNTQGTSIARGAMSQVPIIGPPISGLMAPSTASMSSRPVTPPDNMDALEGVGQVGGAAIGGKLLTSEPGTIGGPEFPKTSANLINHWLGKGAIDEVLNKNAGRGISKAKIVAATADGVQEGVKSAITKWQSHKQTIMDTPLAQAPTIDGPTLIKEAFGEPPLNIPRTTLEHWNEFAANIGAKVQEISGGTGKLSPAQVDALKNEIDVNFGKLSTDATELNLNQKAGSVRRAFDRAVDKSIPGYKEINDHLADLHHANDILTTKIKENAESTPFSINPKSALRGVMADALSPGGPKGTRPGLLTTPGRTALAAALSKAPDIPSMPSGSMTAPPAMEAPVISPHTMPEPITPTPQSVTTTTSGPPAAPIAPDLPDPALRPIKPSATAPKLPAPPTMTPAEEHAQLISKRDAIIKEAVQKDDTPNLTLKDEAARRAKAKGKEPTAASTAPTKPAHVQEGSQVSGLDEQGNIVSGSLEKLYPVVENGKPVWKGTILDIRNSRTVDLPADKIFDRLSGPPKTAITAKPKTTPKAEIPQAPLSKSDAAKKAVQDFLDRKALMDMEEQHGAGPPKKGKR
jgi:hypothetical protein